MNIAIQSVFDVIFVTGIVLVTGGIDSVYSVLYSLVIIYSTLFMGRKGGLSIAALSSLCYVVLINLDVSTIFEFLYDEGIVPRGELTRSYILTRAITHVASFFLIALLTSFVVEQERKTKRLLAEKVTAFDRLDLLHRSIIESVDTGILTVNLEGHIRSFNRAAEEISGYASGEVGNRSIEDIFPGVSAIISPIEPEERKRQRKRFEIVIRKKSGESMILGISESPLFERGVKIGSILIFQDLTSFKEMEREGEKNKQFAFIGQMAAGLAHELRTPLQSISGSIQILRRDLKLEPTDERLMQVILRAKDQMESLVRNFLLMARSNRGRRSETDIGRLVEDVIESLTYGAEWNSQRGAPQNPRAGAAGDGRSRRDPADPLEPDDQCHAVHAGRGHAQRHSMPRQDRRGGAGREDRDRRYGLRDRHGRSGKDLGALLHDEGAGKRPGPCHREADRREPRGCGRRAERRPVGHSFLDTASPDRTGSARTRRRDRPG